MAASRTQDPGLSLRNMEAAKYPDYSLPSLDNITISAQVKGDVLLVLEEILISLQPPTWWGYFLCGVKGVVEEATPAGIMIIGYLQKSP